MTSIDTAVEGLAELGFDRQFVATLDAGVVNSHSLARVVAVHRDRCTICAGSSDIPAELVGKLLFGAESALDVPTVGDWVLVDLYDRDTHAIIIELVPRKSLLSRKRAGKNIEYQLIAANIDAGFIVQTLDDNFNPRRLERYLVMVNDAGIVPIVLFSKNDLLSKAQADEKLKGISTLLEGLDVISFSNETGDSLEDIESLLQPWKTYCLLGSSGVGKTTLLNRLLGDELHDTRPVRESDSKGRHTTTHRQLIRLPSGALLVDTPGMRELGNLSVETGIEETFPELAVLERQCKFSDCSHTNEKGCAVRAALDTGELSEERYHNYQAMQRESAYNEMSYVEKRKKDHAFGKMIKSAMKEKSKRRE